MAYSCTSLSLTSLNDHSFIFVTEDEPNFKLITYVCYLLSLWSLMEVESGFELSLFSGPQYVPHMVDLSASAGIRT